MAAECITLLGSNTYAADRRGAEFRTGVELVARYRDEIAALQTHEFPLDRVEEAFRTAADKTSGAIKVTIIPGDAL